MFQRAIHGLGLIPVLVLALLLPTSFAQAEDVRGLIEVEGEYKEIREMLNMAIADQGLVIAHVSNVGEMLERTGKDLGATREPFVKAEVVEFCSASFSRKLMEADPRNLLFCPFAVAIYTVPEKPGIVHLTWLKLGQLQIEGSNEARAAVEGLLQSIAEGAKF
jgi:uncharacterized protein (DUF302 family)